jgi:hypothetical protein
MTGIFFPSEPRCKPPCEGSRFRTVLPCVRRSSGVFAPTECSRLLARPAPILYLCASGSWRNRPAGAPIHLRTQTPQPPVRVRTSTCDARTELTHSGIGARSSEPTRPRRPADRAGTASLHLLRKPNRSRSRNGHMFDAAGPRGRLHEPSAVAARPISIWRKMVFAPDGCLKPVMDRCHRHRGVHPKQYAGAPVPVFTPHADSHLGVPTRE